MNSNPELAPIFVRVYSRVRNEKPRKEQWKSHDPKWANFALVLDCETTIDIRQDLTFLWWRFCELKDGNYVCQQEGVVYNDHLDKEAVALIRSYARKRADVEDGCPEEIQVNSRTEFANGYFWEAIRAGAAIVCFNSPFDLSRLAVKSRGAKLKNTGWSVSPWPDEADPFKPKPWIRIQPKDSRSAFINLVGGDSSLRVVYAGRFLDLSVLGWALRNQHMDLNGFLKSFGLKLKAKHEPTGLVTEAELKYGRRDTERTVELLNAMKHEYDGFPLELPAEQAMSAASITKAFLEEMEISKPAKKFKLSEKVLGQCMQTYYGGRSEIRIRHQEMPVVVCDTTSEYPSVAALLELWPLLTAADVQVVDCTGEARATLRRATLEGLLSPFMWGELAFFASVKPGGDILPVRSLYNDTGNTNIGLNPLTSSKPIWYSGPDLATSKLQKGSAPAIIEAFKLVPVGIQKGMRGTRIGTRNINPETDDFFRAIIEERKSLPKEHPHYLLLKIIANSLYGIFAELNKFEYGKNKAKQLDVFSGEIEFDQQTCVVESEGRWHFPPAAALITAGGRLMLAILQAMVEEKKGTYLLTDTDSLFFVASQRGGLIPCPGGNHKTSNGTPAIKAVTWKQVEQICAKLNRLNPYNRELVGEILKIEDCNYDRAKNQHQLYGLAVSAKRYVIYTRRKSKIEIIKPSEHGLGIVYVPDQRKRYTPKDCKDRDTSYPRWIVEAWERLLDDYFRNVGDPENALVSHELWFGNIPAVMRIRVTTPNVMAALRKHDPGAAKPYNFALSPILVDAPPSCTLVGPFSKHPEEWLTRDYTEIHTGATVHLFGDYNGQNLVPQTLSGVLWRHYLHPEDKALAPDGKPCGPYTSGLLLRRPVHAMIPFITIGKEVERKAQEGEDISILENLGPIRYQSRQTIHTRALEPSLQKRVGQFSLRQLTQSGLSKDTVIQARRGARLHPNTRARLARAVEKLEHGPCERT
jgi:hypothetical protein